MQIVSRAQWGARPPRSRVTGDTIRETFLHHSVGYGPGGDSYMRIMQNQHMDINGWSDLAYNFVVDPQDLRVFEGRGWGVRPGSQKSHNRGTWSVCVMGDYRTTRPTQGLLTTIASLIQHGATLGHIPLVLTGGHRDAPNQSTTCPGDRLHSRIPDIRNLLEDDMPSPKDWTAADWAAYRANTGQHIIDNSVGAFIGSGDSRRRITQAINATEGLAAATLLAVRAHEGGDDVDEAEVARLILQGLPVSAIADALGAEFGRDVADEIDRRARERLG